MFLIHDWRVGRKTFKGKPLVPGPPEEVVTVVETHEAIEAFGCKDRQDLVTWLRHLREVGLLISEPGRLTARIRHNDGSRSRGYVVRGGIQPKRSNLRVLSW